MPRRYPPEFRRKVLDLLKSGCTVAEVAAGLGVTAQTIYNWRNQELIDTGQRPGLSSIESAELAAARRRIAELETELAIATRSTELLKSVAAAKGGSKRSR
ncbi:transposase [Rhodococcus sp. KBS0724]|uniref:transposase n=1 Tax=Rhodococcus sp. KBS0724 TaxID=1179674 RepID=UPI00110DDF9F|nr:transposase [Rhodococcus sp. KBS0724]TSD47489.1 transposase [Rhodococcus sp. KBS0724]